MGGIIVSNLKVDDVDKDSKSATEDKILDDINTAQTPGKGRTVLLNLKGNDNIEDVAKVLEYIDTSGQLAKDDFRVTTNTAPVNLRSAPDTARASRDCPGEENQPGPEQAVCQLIQGGDQIHRRSDHPGNQLENHTGKLD